MDTQKDVERYKNTNEGGQGAENQSPKNDPDQTGEE